MISIIIPTKDRPDLLRQCIGSIREHFKPEHEIVVVENGECLESMNYAQSVGCLVICEKGLTFAQACNFGATMAKGNELLLCNNDIIFTKAMNFTGCPSWSIDIFGYRLLYPNGLVQHAGIGFDMAGNPYHRWEWASPQDLRLWKSRRVPAVTFALARISAATWRMLGGLCEDYINAYEDVDFCLRALEIHRSTYYVGRTLEAVHMTGQTAGRNDKIAESWKVFHDRWVATGRLYDLLGIWPFKGG